MTSSELLEVDNLSKCYNPKSGIKALDGVSVSVARGEFVSVIGCSGAGKSTFLRCINRLIDPTAGSVVFDGEDVTRMPKRQLRNVRRRISMIFQHYNLVYRASAIENVLQGRLGYKSSIAGALGLYSEEEKRNAFDILAKVGLAEFAYKRADQLSGGQMQRVGIARALVQDPLLMLCDEPIASLDPRSSRVIMEQLRWACDELGVACLVNLHQVDYAIEFSDRIIGLKQGKLVFDGTPDELDAKVISYIYGTPYVREHATGVQAGEMVHHAPDRPGIVEKTPAGAQAAPAATPGIAASLAPEPASAMSSETVSALAPETVSAMASETVSSIAPETVSAMTSEAVPVTAPVATRAGVRRG